MKANTIAGGEGTKGCSTDTRKERDEYLPASLDLRS